MRAGFDPLGITIMRFRLVLLALVIPLLSLAAGQEKAGGTPPRPAPAPATTASVPGVPARATPLGPNSWRFTDPEGKTWVYYRTPFGISRSAEQKPAAAGELPAGWKAVQAGDEIQFERPTPFGVTRWSRKKDQLTDVERRLWERDCPKDETKSAGEKAAAKE